MDLRLTDVQVLLPRCVRGHVRHHFAVKCLRDAMLTAIGEGAREVRLLVIARRCLAA